MEDMVKVILKFVVDYFAFIAAAVKFIARTRHM